MIIMVRYCYLRKDGTFNQVVFDTEKKELLNNPPSHQCVFVEAKMSCDVNALRNALIKDGYKIKG